MSKWTLWRVFSGSSKLIALHLQQREITFAFLRAADHALDRVAGAQAEASNLGRRDVDVVRARKVIGVGRAQEGEAVLQHLDDAFADNLDIAARELLEDREHQLLLAHDRSVFDFVLFGKGEEFGWRFLLQVLELDFPHGRTFTRTFGPQTCKVIRRDG